MAGFFDKLLGRGASANAEAAKDNGYPAKLPDTEIDAVFARADEELRLKTAAHNGSWRAGESSWDVDLEAGVITFRNPAGWVITAPVQLVGTLLPDKGTWLWGWDHPSAPEPARAHAKLVHAFGTAQDLAALTTRQIEATEEDAWSFTALAAHLAGANGAYRGPAGPAMVFMTFGDIEITKP
jgi:hypothetical protein